jgi:methionyl-tRNA formyltransferase
VSAPRVVLLSKRDHWCRDAANIAASAFDGMQWISGSRHDPFPSGDVGEPDYLISFLSPWIVPPAVLEKTKLAINFHPASSQYPGIGCYNFALYEDAAQYGAVVHHMAPRVDSGDLIEERLFTIWPNETVESLKLRTMVVMLSMFHDTVGLLAADAQLPRSTSTWSRRPFTRKELDGLAVVTPEMDAAEVARRVRATTYPGFPGASVELAGMRFSAPVPEREPFA